MTQRLQPATSILIFTLFVCLFSVVGTSQQPTQTQTQTTARYAVETGSIEDLKDVRRVYVFTGGVDALRARILTGISSLSLQVVDSADEADVVLVVTSHMVGAKPDFGVPYEYQPADTGVEDGAVTAAILRPTSKVHAKLVFTRQYAASESAAAADDLLARFTETYKAANTN